MKIILLKSAQEKKKTKKGNEKWEEKKALKLQIGQPGKSPLKKMNFEQWPQVSEGASYVDIYERNIPDKEYQVQMP